MQCHQPRITHGDWCRLSGELKQSGRYRFNKNLMHTECVNQEVVLDLVDVPKVRLVLPRKSQFSCIRTRSPPSDRLGQSDGDIPIKNEFWKLIERSGGQHRGKRHHRCCIVVLPFSFQFCIRLKQFVNIISLVGEGSLTPNTERLLRFPIKAPVFRPDCILRSFDYSHEFPEYQSRIWAGICHNVSCMGRCFLPKARVRVCGR